MKSYWCQKSISSEWHSASLKRSSQSVHMLGTPLSISAARGAQDRDESLRKVTLFNTILKAQIIFKTQSVQCSDETQFLGKQIMWHIVTKNEEKVMQRRFK